MRNIVFMLWLVLGGVGFAFDKPMTAFLEAHCFDCHGDGAAKGGLDLEKLGHDLSDPAVFAKWERLFDRVALGEMPPADRDWFRRTRRRKGRCYADSIGANTRTR
jgi:hypothetical protein